MTIALDVWHVVFQFLHADAAASVRLLGAMAQLWREKKDQRDFWVRMESRLPNHQRYLAYKAANKHLGIRRRVMSWTHYCDSPCSRCRTDLFMVCTGTFPVRLKLCYACKNHALISEPALHYWFPYWKKPFRFCWIPTASGLRVRHYAFRDLKF